jgi:hypothetical protein
MNELLDRDDQNGIAFSAESISHLHIASKWAKFIAIFGFVMTGFYLLVMLFSLTANIGLVAGAPIIFIILYLGFIFLFFFWIFQFSRNAQNAINSNDSHQLAQSMRYLKYYFVAMGVLLLIMVIFMVIAIFFAMAVGAFNYL